MDIYSKGVLTVIAGALIVIAFNLTIKSDRAFTIFGGGPTWGDYLSAINDKDTSRKPADVVLRAPLVAVCDGPRCINWSKR